MKMFRRQEECLPLAHTNIQDCSLVEKIEQAWGHAPEYVIQMASLIAQLVKNPPAIQETPV